MPAIDPNNLTKAMERSGLTPTRLADELDGVEVEQR